MGQNSLEKEAYTLFKKGVRRKPKTKKDYDFSRQPKPSNNSEWPKKPAYTPRRGHEKWVKIPQKKDEANVIFWRKTDVNKLNEKQHKKIDRWRV